MTPAEIEALGREHFGDKWVAPLASAAGVSRHLVYRWLDGSREVSPASRAMLTLLKQKLKRRKPKP